MKLEKRKLIKIGNAYGLLIPAAIVDQKLLRLGDYYNIDLQEVSA